MDSIWGIIATPLGFIMRWCYLFVNDVLHLPVAYVFALFLFTIVTKLLLFPLSLRQQRSSAVTQAYQPLINEINQKYANDPQKRQEEMNKFTQEYGYKPMAGCLPLLIQFPIIFGLVEVVYKPLTYMIRIPKDVLGLFTAKASEILGVATTDRNIETSVIELAKTNIGALTSVDPTAAGVTGAEITEYANSIANLDMTIGQINLWEKPALEWSWGLLIPIFSILTIILSSLVSQWAVRGKTQEQNRQAKMTTYTMLLFSTVMFGFMSFTLPAAFSLYWGFSNIVVMLQSLILKKIVNADTIRAEAEAKIEAKKQEKKAAKKVKVKTKSGKVEEKELAADELARYRLQRARELDDQRFNDISDDEK